ncbi:hypothetical protein SAMN05421797_102301 [Maribacter ulvicola]|uniref:Uncharacterized protein n=1 Tax=Maribacter ulvicola TaxID=228959 RepID=A0A1N6UD63_9FLAO|nr:hypothetical protein SAMN05421797_102301 [Maribacter ulvicola]
MRPRISDGKDSAMLSLILILTPKPKNIRSASPAAEIRINIGAKKNPKITPNAPEI